MACYQTQSARRGRDLATRHARSQPRRPRATHASLDTPTACTSKWVTRLHSTWPSWNIPSPARRNLTCRQTWARDTPVGVSYPEDWPEGCPPAEAQPAQGTFYRILNHAAPTLEDFQSHHERGLAPNADRVKRCGLSIYETQAQARHRQKLTPRLGQYLSAGSLTPESGVISASDRSGHITWWPAKDVQRHLLFGPGELC
ncbi:MAG: hypothetical protein RL701_1431 [Pseudomonadota bacterium]|jgi:hypothetical protein